MWRHPFSGYMMAFGLTNAVEDEILLAADLHVRKTVFPASRGGDPFFRTVDLTESRALVLASCPSPPFPPLSPRCSCPSRRSRRSRQHLTKKHPVAKFPHKRGSKRKLTTYFERIGKRARRQHGVVSSCLN